MNLKYINPYYWLKSSKTRSMQTYEIFEDPIYDRTEEDIRELKNLLELGYKNFNEEQKTRWESNLKGALNDSDLNRIEKNISILGKSLGVNVNAKSWNEVDIPQTDDFERLKNGLSILVNKLEGANFSINVPDLPWNTYQKINDVEKLIFEIFNILRSQFYYFCTESGNDLYCGENIGLS